MSRYITTTLPYVNADPHLGHALEFIEADCYVRTLRLAGEEVFFNIGTDEHGAKVVKRAEESGKLPMDFVDYYAEQFKQFAKKLNISEDTFLRTTDPRHEAAAQEMWRRCAAAGDIYKANYEIKYCVGCELEKSDSELVEGKCPLHPMLAIEIRNEENYFFRFSKYQAPLLAHYAAQADFVVPSERFNEIKSFVAAGLKDFSVSRPADKLSWGVKVPGDEMHIMYVWFDALTSYLSAIEWPQNEETFAKWWPVTHLAGKDNLRQQSAMFQAMLLSAGLPPSKQIFIHGLITSKGQKMSKSIGNVIDPMEVAHIYGVDALRYVLLRHAHPFEDTDLTLEHIHEYYTANLVNGLGNLVARVMQLAEKNVTAPPGAPAPVSDLGAFIEHINKFEFNQALDYAWHKIQELDKKITDEEPFKVIKVDPEKGKAMISAATSALFDIARMIEPAMPATAEMIKTAILANKKPENLFPRLPAQAGL